MLRTCVHRASRFASASPVGQLGQRGVKDTTGIVGIDVDPNARASLRDICQQVLKAIQVVPDTAEYRRSVESAMKYRIKQVDSDQADEDIESAFGLQLEQLILQGKSELDLIPMMAEWKPWDVPEGHEITSTIEEPVATGDRVVKEPVKQPQ